MTAGYYARMRASSADTERTITVLQTSFVEGRLTRDELDHRLGEALLSRFFAELMALIADLPVGTFGRLPAHPVTPASSPSRRPALCALGLVLALVSLVVLIAGIAAAHP